MSRFALLGAGIAALAAASPAGATWSIAIADSETKEVAIGTVTCLTTFDLCALVPVVVVGKGSAAVQAAGDFDGIRRPIIFSELMAGTAPQDILDILAGVTGHQQRQYGIVDTNAQMVSFTGSGNGQWAGGLVGSQGAMVYAIQGNVLAGDCVTPAIEAAILGTKGDIPAKLMAGMQAARDQGGDGRCSCNSLFPTICGCPVPKFTKAGHIGCMVVARVGDTDDPLCDVDGCADGDYFMRLNVAGQTAGDPDPVDQLQDQFDAFRAGLVGRPDGIQSTVAFPGDVIPPNGVSSTTMTVTLLDWQGLPITAPVLSLDVQHAPGSAGLSTIGAPVDLGNGVFEVPITSGAAPGLDRFRVTADEGARQTVLAPDAAFEYFTPGDLDGDGQVGILDFLGLLALWGPCPNPCAADIDGDGTVGILDFLALLANWGPG